MRSQSFRQSTLGTVAAAALLFSGPTASQAHGDPQVVVTVAPVHSLVARVMAGVGEPTLLLPPGTSPHRLSLRPSQMAALQAAELVVWVGPTVETALTGPLETLGDGVAVLSMEKVEGMTVLPVREGGLWEAHDHAHSDHADDKHGHDDHGHDDHGHDDHGHDDHGHDDHGHDDHGHDDHGHDDNGHEDHGHDDHGHDDHGHDDHGHDDHGHDHAHAADAHLWLDIDNARILAQSVTAALVSLDPDHAEVYQTNLSALEAELSALDAELRTTLEPIAEAPYIVFHDAYQYFEARYGLGAVGSVTVSPEVQPGAQRVAEIQARIAQTGATCVFSEPQFEPAIVATLIDGTAARSGVLDPLGAGLEPGPDQYPALMRALAANLVDCLEG